MSSRLTLQQKKFLRQVDFSKSICFSRFEDPKNFMLLSSYEIYNRITNKILDSGYDFEKIERCAPIESNCIIRTYQLVNFEYADDEFYSCYGAISYIMRNCRWETFYGRRTHHIHYDRLFLQIGPLPDDSIRMVESDFSDFPVKIS